MLANVTAGLVYFAIVFGAGFVFGIARVLVIEPGLGDFAAVTLELPLILAVAWFASRWAVRRWSVPARSNARIAMGAVAFGTLMLAEFLLSYLMDGTDMAGFLLRYREAANLLGLIGQLAFASFPLLQARMDPHWSTRE